MTEHETQALIAENRGLYHVTDGLGRHLSELTTYLRIISRIQDRIRGLIAASEPGDETAAPIPLLEACGRVILTRPVLACQWCGAEARETHKPHCSWHLFRQAVEDARKAAEPPA